MISIEEQVRILTERVNFSMNAIDTIERAVNGLTRRVENIEVKVGEHLYTLEEKIQRLNKKVLKEDSVSKKHYEESLDDTKHRLSKLESYIGNDKFHNLLCELTKMEDEFHDRALKLVSGSIIKNKSNRKKINE